ncbi:toxin-antitoxin system TumE family protein [Candidatus Magnetominusculus dajiuhuensis]|uniref:toxin-antitoxin system TumE family protein n=1 Tax=Candidatus Magnetominusculus dajiuhuensis TaxID=3137712 RepID=UPI003B436DBB
MLILKLINGADFIASYEVMDYKKWDRGSYSKLRIVFNDSSVLFVREYVDELQRDYSFHWQSSDDAMIIRWDNAPHYKELLTFPHHKHMEGSIIESRVVSLEDVLTQIKGMLKDKKP